MKSELYLSSFGVDTLGTHIGITEQMASILAKGFAEFKLLAVLRLVSPCSWTGFKPRPPWK